MVIDDKLDCAKIVTVLPVRAAQGLAKPIDSGVMREQPPQCRMLEDMDDSPRMAGQAITPWL